MSDNKATPTTTPTKANAVVTPRDSELIFRVLQNMKDKRLDVDWEQVAKEMGYKSAAVASTRFRQVRKSMESSFESLASTGGSGAEATTPSKALKVKGAKVAKATPKARAQKKAVASPVNKGAKDDKLSAVVTKEEDGGMGEEMKDGHAEEAFQYVKREMDEDDSYDMAEDAYQLASNMTTTFLAPKANNRTVR